MSKTSFSALVIIFFMSISTGIFAQDESLEVYLIEAYVPSDSATKFILSFAASEPCKATLVLDERFRLTVSDTLSEDHRRTFDISGMRFDTNYVLFYILTENAAGNKFRSEYFDLILPEYNLIHKDIDNGFLTICFGGVIFGFPSPSAVLFENKSYFALNKQIPLVSFYSGGFNYPMHTLGIGYSYLFNAPFNHIFRADYHFMRELPVIEYAAAGIGGFTNFNRFSGYSFDITLGLFEIYESFILYTSLRHNREPDNLKRNYGEIMLGLHSNFFSINIY